MISTSEVVRLTLVGAGATAVMDLWSMLLRAAGVPTLSYAWVGRWTGHLLRGRFAHAAIARAEPVPGELALGWAIHYAVGIVFAALLVGVQGLAWLRAPEWLPALAVGVATVVVPLFIMQPAMGAGFAASRTPAPVKNCLRSLMTHAVFGSGLYLAALTLNQFWR